MKAHQRGSGEVVDLASSTHMHAAIEHRIGLHLAHMAMADGEVIGIDTIGL